MLRDHWQASEQNRTLPAHAKLSSSLMAANRRDRDLWHFQKRSFRTNNLLCQEDTWLDLPMTITVLFSWFITSMANSYEMLNA